MSDVAPFDPSQCVVVVGPSAMSLRPDLDQIGAQPIEARLVPSDVIADGDPIKALDSAIATAFGAIAARRLRPRPAHGGDDKPRHAGPDDSPARAGASIGRHEPEDPRSATPARGVVSSAVEDA